MPAKTVFDFTITTTPQAVIVRLIGDAGVGNADALSHALLPISASKPAIVVFDLSQLKFISSLGLGMLVQFQRGLSRHGGSTRIASPQPFVHDLLIKSRFNQVLPIFDSVDAALAQPAPHHG